MATLDIPCNETPLNLHSQDAPGFFDGSNPLTWTFPVVDGVVLGTITDAHLIIQATVSSVTPDPNHMDARIGRGLSDFANPSTDYYIIYPPSPGDVISGQVFNYDYPPDLTGAFFDGFSWYAGVVALWGSGIGGTFNGYIIQYPPVDTDGLGAGDLYQTLDFAIWRITHTGTGGGPPPPPPPPGPGPSGPSAEGTGPANLHDRAQRYHVATVDAGDISYHRSDFSVPLPWAITGYHLTDDGANAAPCIAEATNGRLYAVYCKSGTDTWLRHSDDDGLSWASETNVIPSGIRPRIAVQDGGILITAQVSGILKGVFQGAGDTAFSAAFTCKDQAGADLALADQEHDVSGSGGNSVAGDPSGRWLLAAIPSGGTEVKAFVSTDEGRTWNLLT